MSVTKTGKTRKPRGPARPPLAQEPTAAVVDSIPAPTARRTKWTEYVELARSNAGQWVQVGPFYRDTAMSTRHRLLNDDSLTDIEVQVRHIDAETSNVFLRAVA